MLEFPKALSSSGGANCEFPETSSQPDDGGAWNIAIDGSYQGSSDGAEADVCSDDPG